MNYVDIFGEDRDRTISTRFLLPMIASSSEKFIDYGQTKYWKQTNADNRFINAFKGMIDKPWLDNHIFLVYRIVEADDRYVNNMIHIRKNPNFYDHYTYIDDDETFQVFCFTVPKEFQKDYNYINKGLYSQCSNSLKNKVLKFWNLSSRSFTYALFNKQYMNGNTIFEQARVQDNGEVLPPPGKYEVIPEEIIPDEESGIII